MMYKVFSPIKSTYKNLMFLPSAIFFSFFYTLKHEYFWTSTYNLSGSYLKAFNTCGSSLYLNDDTWLKTRCDNLAKIQGREQK